MGCGTSKSVDTIENSHSGTNGSAVKDNVVVEANGGTQRRMSRPMTPVPKPVAFDIPMEDQSANGTLVSDGTLTMISKKLPPKRLLSLAEQPSQQLTAKELSDKQMKAEEKRLELLAERSRKARDYNEKFLVTNSSNNSHNASQSSVDEGEGGLDSKDSRHTDDRPTEVSADTRAVQ